MPKPQSPYQDPKTRHPIYDFNLPFSDYIIQCQHLMTSHRVDLESHAEKIISLNSPFELRPDNIKNDTGVLLVHGLLETPFMMKDIGKRLYQQGALVRAILLPGHGTVPGDLLSVHYEDWIQAVRYGISTLKNDVKRIYLVGFSTGAALSLHQTLHDAKIEGAILLAPALKIRSNIDFASNWHYIISWFWERAKWLHLDPENDCTKYQSLCFNAVYQVYRLSHLIKKISKTHLSDSRKLYILSKSDITVSAHATIEYFEQYKNPYDRLIAYTHHPSNSNDPQIIERCPEFPDMKVHDLSHIGLTISPQNPHYGLHGDYVNASHPYESDHVVYGDFSRLENKLCDLLYKNKLIKSRHERLTFNPDFEFMMKEIEEFIG